MGDWRLIRRGRRLRLNWGADVIGSELSDIPKVLLSLTVLSNRAKWKRAATGLAAYKVVTTATCTVYAGSPS